VATDTIAAAQTSANQPAKIERWKCTRAALSSNRACCRQELLLNEDSAASKQPRQEARAIAAGLC